MSDVQKVYDATGKVLEVMKGLTREESEIVFRHVRELLGTPAGVLPKSNGTFESGASDPGAANVDGPHGKEPGAAFFLKDKKPQQGSHRVACLAFYLKKFRNVPEFKTEDISQLTRELRLPPLSNPSFYVSDAAKLGYLMSIGGGLKAITPGGEAFVEALPDLDAARNAMKENSLGRAPRSKPKKAKADKKD